MYYYGKVIAESEKTQTRTSTVFMVLIIWPSSTLKFLFVFGFNECLWAIFSFGIKFWKFMVLYLGCGCMSFDFTTQMTLSHLLSYPCPWIKTSKSVLKCWERSVKRNSNRNFIRVIKNSSFDQHFLCICMVKTFLKIIWWRFLVPCSELLLVNCVYLSCKIRNISTLSMLLCHSTNSFFLRSISLMHRLVCSVH